MFKERKRGVVFFDEGFMKGFMGILAEDFFHFSARGKGICRIGQRGMKSSFFPFGKRAFFYERKEQISSFFHPLEPTEDGPVGIRKPSKGKGRGN